MGPGFESQPGHKQELLQNCNFFCLRGEIGRHAILRGWFPKDVLVRVQSQALQKKIVNSNENLKINFIFIIINYDRPGSSAGRAIHF